MMSRRNGMIMTILCILVVGVSVTKMTRKFVASEEAGAAAITSVMENAAGAAQQAVPIEAEETTASIKQLNEQVTAKEEPAPGMAAKTRNAPFPEDKGAGSDAQKSGESGEGTGLAAAEDTYGGTGENTAEEAAAEDEAAEKVLIKIGEAAAETVKSPLDPALETEERGTDFLIEAEKTVVYTGEDLAERLSLAEEKSAVYREAVVESNVGSAYTSAEQERILWDRELNIIYTSIRDCMSEKEAEELKVSELEWLKERDLAADKAAAKNTALPQNQNPDSARVLAEKTRERCYELLSDYGDVLE